LSYSAWISVEYPTLEELLEARELFTDDAEHDLVGNKTSSLHLLLYLLRKRVRRSFLDELPKQVASRNGGQVVVDLEFGALGAFTSAWCANQPDAKRAACASVCETATHEGIGRYGRER